ncbi:hypothetical protein [Butyricicoccus pullicaecorum]|uniref:hypothetical protein n=1 Tax=Butyricicoccus pullicaecorum TaxID=501571 RepID=UPI003990BFFD
MGERTLTELAQCLDGCKVIVQFLNALRDFLLLAFQFLNFTAQQASVFFRFCLLHRTDLL